MSWPAYDLRLLESLPLPVIAVVFFTAFEVLVSFLQAYVFALLSGVYIGSSLSEEH